MTLTPTEKEMLAVAMSFGIELLPDAAAYGFDDAARDHLLEVYRQHIDLNDRDQLLAVCRQLVDAMPEDRARQHLDFIRTAFNPDVWHHGY